MLGSVFMSGIGICTGIIDGMTLGALLPYYVISLFGLYVYFSVSSLVDVAGKRKILKTNLVDYLENHMVNHLNITCEKESIEPVEEKNKKSGTFTQNEEEELAELIREFLA